MSRLSVPAGTLAGVAMALRERNPGVKIALADPPGAAIYNYYTRGELKAEGSSITEGIGQGRITGNLEGLAVDFAYQIPDDQTVQAVFDALQHEGLCVGASTGVNLVGAARLARELGPGHTIVTILSDSGLRYQSRLFNSVEEGAMAQVEKRVATAWQESGSVYNSTRAMVEKLDL